MSDSIDWVWGQAEKEEALSRRAEEAARGREREAELLAEVGDNTNPGFMEQITEEDAFGLI